MTARLAQRQLGGTGMQVSALGLGTVKIGRNEGVKYPSGFSIPDDQAVQHLLARALELDINLVDTAPAYGSSEERLGKLLPRRQDWIICSKTGEEFDAGKSFFDFSARHTRFSIERSLRRLRTDYLDIVLVHSDGNDQHVIEHTDCLETLQRCREEGLIRAVGFSGKTVAGGLLAAQHTDVVMVTCNPRQTDEIPVIEAAARLQAGVLIKKAFNSGHDVAGKAPENVIRDNLRFIFSQPGVSAVIAGTINPDHLLQNADTLTRVLSDLPPA